MKQLLSKYAFAPIDWHLAQLLTAPLQRATESLGLAIALVSKRCREGHVCAALSEVAGLPLTATELFGEESPGNESWPPLEPWLELIQASTLVTRADAFDPSKPLVLSGDRLYLTRYFLHETALREKLCERLSAPLLVRDPSRIRPSIEALYAPLHSDSERQRLAIALALGSRLCIVTGGPGTGKTTAIVRLLAVLIEEALRSGEGVPVVRLLAPTGKAASRIAESIRFSKEKLPIEDAIKRAIPDHAETLHRALGSAARAERRKRQRLAADIVIVDEASMVDLALMRRLFDACVQVPRLILLGDPEQLESVLAGSVLSELTSNTHAGYHHATASLLQSMTGLEVVTSPREAPSIHDCRIELTVSHRFTAESGVGSLAMAVRDGNSDEAWAILNSGKSGVRFVQVAQKGPAASKALVEIAESGYRLFRAAATPEAAFDALFQFRILCGHRHGPLGVEAVNAALCERIASRARRASASAVPLLITENAPDLTLFNGDVGVLWRDRESSQAQQAYVRSSAGALRCFSIARLPAHETAFAMTVHKSQGSEIDQVVFILPGENSPLLSRELLYTAITRARTACTILGTQEAFVLACKKKSQRFSGLAQQLAVAAPERVAQPSIPR